jgi:hypothetical protein
MGPRPRREDSPYDGMDDNAVIEEARRIYSRLQRVPRWSDENDSLLRAWGGICGEMGRRGICDAVTEGRPAGDKLMRLMTGREGR